MSATAVWAMSSSSSAGQRTELGDARGADVDGVQIPVTLEAVEHPHVLSWDLDDGQVRALAQHRHVQQRATG